MDIDNIDFDGTASGSGGTQAQPTNNSEDKTPIDNSQPDVTNLNNGENNEPDNNAATGSNSENTSSNSLNVGDELEIDNNRYKVADNGDIVDEQGNVFKAANEVDEWLKGMNVESNDEDTDALNINNIQKQIGIDITDDNGQAIEFTNDVKGITSYVNSVINLKSAELQEAAINKLFNDQPILKQFMDYYAVNGSARGFGDIPDRSKIKLDPNDTNQLIGIIAMAEKELRGGEISKNYLNYLKDNDGLYDEAKKQLENLVNKDKEYKKAIEAKAKAKAEEQAAADKQYWTEVTNTINSGQIGDIKIPNSFVKTIDGQKRTVTRNDFLNYISVANQTDANGNKITQYQKDLANLTDKQYLNKELQEAYLLFTGNDVKVLAQLSAQEDKVRQLKIVSKEQRNNKSNVRVIKSKSSGYTADDIVFD